MSKYLCKYLCKDIIKEIEKYINIEDIIKNNWYEAFIEQNSCSEYTWCLAVKYKRLKMLKWLNKTGTPYVTFEITDIAAKKGYLKIIKWFHKFYDERAISLEGFFHAITNGHFKVVKWIVKNNRRIQELKPIHAINEAVMNGNLKMVKFLCKSGFECPKIAFWNAAYDDHESIMNFLYKKFKSPELSLSLIEFVMAFDNLDKFKNIYKYRNKLFIELPTIEEMIKTALYRKNYDVALWLKEQQKRYWFNPDEIIENILKNIFAFIKVLRTFI
jgi:hypothetical protein